MRVPSESFSVLVEESNHAAPVPGRMVRRRRGAGLYQAVAHSGSRDVVLNIEDLEFIDGAGWLGVIGCEQRVASRGGRLRIDNGIGRSSNSRHLSIAGTVIA